VPSKRELGAACEALACQHLEAQGYAMVARNVSVPGGELDIIAHDGEVLCFIEVRGRVCADFGHPLETIDALKQKRIARAAAAYLSAHPHAGPCRFDAVGVLWGAGDAPPTLTLVRGAFVPTRIY
jgi:putative endonuclease